MRTPRATELFDRILDAIKRLALDYGLTDDEAKDLGGVADTVNGARERYTDRTLKALPGHQDNAGGRTDNDVLL